ncbi:hypothetical protein SO802_021946 [Lithocarpus litseifolius]|uniref:Uncharacterized protein n=1 Tax=Lithocarpus litseifolius TaxID=425828 RepID=A0AAW2CL67_9ROSI
MEVLRKIGGGCFKGKDSMGVIKVEADSGGEDVFRVSSGALPDHPVVMVNGHVGRPLGFDDFVGIEKIVILRFLIFGF